MKPFFMIIQPKENLIQALEKAKEINEIYRIEILDYSNPVRSVDDLLDITKKYINASISVEKHGLGYEAQPIRSLLLSMNDGSHRIVLLAEQNNSWCRMILCKELFHILLQDEESYNKNVKALIDEATMQSIQIDGSRIPPSKALQMELLAEIAAMEFLFPFVIREKILSNSTSIDFEKIAEEYQIPQQYIEEYLAEKRMNLLKQFPYTLCKDKL